MPTHGSLTKAGKVRSNTPHIPKTSLKGKTTPRQRNKANHKKRIVHAKPDRYSR